MSRRALRIPCGAAAIGMVLSALVACTKESRAPASTHTEDRAWKPPTEADIPADSQGASIRRGLALLRFTPESLPRYATSKLRCTSCHQQDGRKESSAPLTGAHTRFPKYLPRSGAVVTLADRVNYCFTRSLAGNAIPSNSREMVDILAYLAFLSHGLPVGGKNPGAGGLIAMRDTLAGDSTRGHRLFTEKCVACHQADGGGMALVPPLWGPHSYSVGASMARLERGASFIMHNMPQTAPGTLSAQEAFDLSAFINAHPRPDAPGKEHDWPDGSAPRDVPYATKGHAAFHPPPLVTRRTTTGALVPPPVSLSHGTR